ncbi:MAG: hypothetical protein AAF411_12385 [Myxococcota bacterium]
MIRYLAAALVLSLSLPVAHACFDGYVAVAGDVMVQAADDQWSARRARQLATWLPRIDALSGDTVEIYYSSAYLADGTELTYAPDHFDELFETMATHLNVADAERLAAKSLETRALTVEVASFRRRADAREYARALLARLDGDEDEAMDVAYGSLAGFYEAGGFPSNNPPIHVVPGRDRGRRIHRVVVGAFLGEDTAEQAMNEITPLLDETPSVVEL